MEFRLLVDTYTVEIALMVLVSLLMRMKDQRKGKLAKFVEKSLILSI
jgi:hypothetical protein